MKYARTKGRYIDGSIQSTLNVWVAKKKNQAKRMNAKSQRWNAKILLMYAWSPPCSRHFLVYHIW